MPKRTHLDTQALCAAEGLCFKPAVVEARGGAWAPAATTIFAELAKTKSLLTGEPASTVLHQLHQNLGIILHRENARAALRRLCAPDTEQWHMLLHSATTLQSTADDPA